MELEETEIELNMKNLGVAEPEGVFQIAEIWLPAVLPCPNHPGFNQGVDELSPHVGEYVELDQLA
jgi:hypothetical protein